MDYEEPIARLLGSSRLARDPSSSVNDSVAPSSFSAPPVKNRNQKDKREQNEEEKIHTHIDKKRRGRINVVSLR